MIVRAGSRSGNKAVIEQYMDSNHRSRLVDPRWIWVGRIGHADLTDADTSQTITLRSYLDATDPLPEDIRAGEYFIDLVEDFAGGGNTAATLIIGRSGDDNAYLTSTDIFTGATNAFSDTPLAAEYSMRTFVGTAFAPLAQFDVTTGTCAGLTAGAVDIYIPFYYLPNGRS